ncbi:hypothetical protein K0M31_006653 [Melipona bicolor]|uniref:Uncharacterized protein n=1 Tax=Melipona bicolor TaxID=60889 RepID=A0AA40FSS1_9HYME|nr:hypothetical protein K0M31_006653 [Melipona bicolor]
MGQNAKFTREGTRQETKIGKLPGSFGFCPLVWKKFLTTVSIFIERGVGYPETYAASEKRSGKHVHGSHGGRRSCLLVCNGFFILGWYFVLLATKVETLYAFRLIFGMGVGIAYTTCPMYLSEVASTEIRGHFDRRQRVYRIAFHLLHRTLGILHHAGKHSFNTANDIRRNIHMVSRKSL